MMDHLLANLVESSVLCQIRNVAVHLTIHLDVLHHIATIGLQAAVEVVQVLNAAHFAGGSIEQFRGQRLRERVVAFLFVARYQVVAVFDDHAIEFWYLIRRILKVGIHCYHHVTLGFLEAAIECRTLAIVTTEGNALHVVRLLAQVVDDLPRTVCRAIVHKNNFVAEAIGFHHFVDPTIEFAERFVLIIKRNNDRYIHTFKYFTFLLYFSFKSVHDEHFSCKRQQQVRPEASQS